MKITRVEPILVRTPLKLDDPSLVERMRVA